MKRLVLVFALFLFVVGSVRAVAPLQSRNVVATSRASDVRQETFDIVWRTVKEKHWDPSLGGVDWDKVRRQYEPRIKDTKTDREFYRLLQDMLDELHQSHFRIIPPEAIVADDSSEPKGGSIGVDIRLIGGQALVSRVESGSKAEAAGVRQGFVVKDIDGVSVEQIVDQFKSSKETPSIIRTRITRSVLGRINGPPETSVRLTVLNRLDQPIRVTVERERLKGEMSARFGNFPPQYTEFEAKRLDGGIGYVRFNVFVMLLMSRIKDAIRGMHDAPGIIIDLRGNPGGIGGMAPGIAGVLETTQTSLGVMRMRVGYNNFAVFPQPNPYTGRVVIVTDGGSASTSEIFAAGMQELGRATIVGERTMGAALPSVFFKLPTGAIFQYAVADFKTPKGVMLEGRGVIPDVEVKLTRKALLEARDPQLEAAILEIKKAIRKVPAGR